MRPTMLRIATIIVLAIAALAGCSQSSIGLFQSIELERKIVDDRDLANDLLVGAVAHAASKYFIAAGALYERDDTDADYPGDVAQWSVIPAPGTAADNFTTTSLVFFDGSGFLYTAYSSQSGTSAGVYAVDPSSLPEAITETERVFGTDVTGVAGVGRLFVAGGQLLVATKDTAAAGSASTYSLYASPDGADGSFTQVTGSVGNLPVIDVAETSGGDVIYLTRKAILVDAGGINVGADPVDVTDTINLTVPDSDPPEDRQPDFGGVYYQESTGLLIVTDDEGYIYRSDDLGLTWTANDTAYEISSTNDSPLQFTDVAALDNGGTELLVVGTQAHGYRELDSSFSPSTPSAEDSNYDASELAQASIICFFVDPGVSGYVPAASGDTYQAKEGDRLFAGTSNLGLWKVLYTGDPPQWVRE